MTIYRVGEAMKFITEMELRDLYKSEPFATYVLRADTKITPGARQFLVDNRVKLELDQCSKGNQSNSKKQNPAQELGSWGTLRLRARMDSIEALFLLTAAELLHSGEVVLSEEVMALGKFFRNLRNSEREELALDNLQFWGWSEEEIKERSDNLGKHVDISEFHVGLENGKGIALINYLQASLREVEPVILEAYWNQEKQNCSRQDLIDKVYLIINILCIMMWKCLGGKQWKG